MSQLKFYCMIDETNLPEEEKKLRENAGAAIRDKEAIHPIEKDIETVRKKQDEQNRREEEAKKEN